MYAVNKMEYAKLLQPCHSDNMQKKILFQCITSPQSILKILQMFNFYLTLACDWFNLLPPPTGK
jgi:hypothetical protein